LTLAKAGVLGSLLIVALYMSGCDKQPASKQRADIDKKKEEEKLKTPLSVAYKKVESGMPYREVFDVFVQECGRTPVEMKWKPGSDEVGLSGLPLGPERARNLESATWGLKNDRELVYFGVLVTFKDGKVEKKEMVERE
jgi:hypothetical protein